MNVGDAHPVPLSQPATRTTVIHSRGLTQRDAVAQSVFLLIAVLACLWVLFVQRPANLVVLLILLGGLVVSFLIADLVVFDRTHVRKVTLDSAGVTFQYLFHRERSPWSELGPAPRSFDHGSWAVVRSIPDWSNSGMWRYYGRVSSIRPPTTRAYEVSLEQARAILLYPSRPKWTIPDSTARSLGVAPEHQ